MESCESQLESEVPTATWVANVQVPGYFSQLIEQEEKALRERVHEILAIVADQRTFANTIQASDNAFGVYMAPTMTLMNLSEVLVKDGAKEDEVTRFAQRHAENQNWFLSNSALYEAIAATPASPGIEFEVKAALLRRMKEKGANLDASVRAQIQKLESEQAVLASAYRLDMQADRTTLAVGGGHEVSVTVPSEVRAFLTQEPDEGQRRKIYLAYRDRVAQNAERLFRITQINNEIARLMGHSGFLRRSVSERSVIGSPEKMKLFLNQLKERFKSLIEEKRQKMTLLKRADGSSEPLRPWDLYYYEAQLQRSTETAVGLDELAAEYFPADEFLQRFFNLMTKLHQIRFEAMPGQKLWDESVQLFRVVDLRAQETLGYLYVDVFSREGGKISSTAFVEEMVARGVRLNGDKGSLPVALLVCNWGDFNQRHKIGLSMGEVQTMFHETGHALHVLFQRGSGYITSGFRHPTDFMEVPSISFDRLVKIPKLLMEVSGRRGHPEQKLSLAQAQSLTASESPLQWQDGDFFSSSHMLNTVFLALLDMELQERILDLKTPDDLHSLYRERYMEFFGIDPGAEDHFIQTFHHIANEYAGNYSSYISAGLVASNISERMQELGDVLDPDVYTRWRQQILEQPQYEKRAEQILIDFLGRPISADPVLRDLLH